MKKPFLRSRAAAAVGVALVVASVAATAGVAQAAIAQDAYLQDYDAEDGRIVPANGNRSVLDGAVCGFAWSSQAVIDSDLENYSVNGFLESVVPSADPAAPGSGHASIQHWYNPGSSTLNWRIPVALDSAVLDARVNLVFDDPDWTPNVASFTQYSPWTVAPGFESAFHRFTGITGYSPHDDSKVSDFEWGVNSEGYTTLSFSLGDIEAKTSTVFQFTGTANGSGAATGAENVANGTAYGARFTVDGRQATATCVEPSYAPTTVLTGGTTMLPPVLAGAGDTAVSVPAGTVFSLNQDSPQGMTIDPATGIISWNVPAGFPVGPITVPVIVTYPDNGSFSAGSVDSTTATITVAKQPRIGPYDDQTLALGDDVDPVAPEVLDHLGLAFGESTSVAVDSLPDGVTYDAESGTISGTPTTIGVSTVRVRALDAAGQQLLDESGQPVLATFTITVTSVPVVTPPTEPTEPAVNPKPSGNTSDSLAQTGMSEGWPMVALGAVGALVAGAFLFARSRARLRS